MTYIVKLFCKRTFNVDSTHINVMYWTYTVLVCQLQLRPSLLHVNKSYLLPVFLNCTSQFFLVDPVPSLASWNLYSTACCSMRCWSIYRPTPRPNHLIHLSLFF